MFLGRMMKSLSINTADSRVSDVASAVNSNAQSATIHPTTYAIGTASVEGW